MTDLRHDGTGQRGCSAASFEGTALSCYVRLVLTAVFWGGTFVAGRIVAREMDPWLAAFLRFVVASAFLVIFLSTLEPGPLKIPRRQVLPVIALGLSGIFAYNLFFFSGLKTVPAGRASLIVACNPVFIAVFSALFFRERMTVLKVLGIMLSLAGASVVIGKGDPLQLLQGSLGIGELYIFGCVMSWVAYSLIGKYTLRDLSPLASVTYACVIGALCLAAPGVSEALNRSLGSYSWSAWISIVYLGLFGSALGFLWYYQGIKAIGPSRAGVFINIVPISSVGLAFFFLNETIDLSLVLGAILVIVGVFLTNRVQVARDR
ncbi:MAG TPA: DMT family transporter [Syntrophobacteraceae bacterium]|nr:DMT family transporter [Syntrophobacteraceae bacterium]